MLKTLILKNLILIEEAHLSFEKGLTILTGETGSGKTALLEAMRLVLGERADATKVRKGCDKAFIQAAFDWIPNEQLLSFFEENGIQAPVEEELILVREISKEGKSRAFCAGQMVPVSFLQKLGTHLVEFIGQHAHVEMKHSDNQRQWLDLYGNVQLENFQSLWQKEKQEQSQLDELKRKKESYESRKAFIEQQLEELNEAFLKEGEEEAVFQEYALLANSQEVLGLSNEVLTHADEAIEKCAKMEALLRKIASFDRGMTEAETMAKDAHLQLSELQSSLQSFQAKMDSEPTRLVYLEERLKKLNSLKKKYGKNPLAVMQDLTLELKTWESLEDRIESLAKDLEATRIQTHNEVQKIRNKRQKQAEKLEEKLTKSLRELNIPTAEVSIRIEPTLRSKTGEDTVSFFLRANQGEQFSSVKDSTSGGELSRLLLSLKLLLALRGTLIFDEVDANIGGETATIIGKKLKKLGEERQVLCITHFPQVAQFGDHHIRVFKEENQGRTSCKIEVLVGKERQREMLRMSGGSLSAISPHTADEDHYLLVDS